MNTFKTLKDFNNNTQLYSEYMSLTMSQMIETFSQVSNHSLTTINYSEYLATTMEIIVSYLEEKELTADFKEFFKDKSEEMSKLYEGRTSKVMGFLLDKTLED